MVFPEKGFLKELKKQNYGRAVVYREIIGDTLTPITLLNWFSDNERVFLLESANLDKSFSRFSFVGAEAKRVIRLYPKRIEVEREGKIEKQETDVFDYLNSLFSGEKSYSDREFGDFTGGFVGNFSYEAVNIMNVLRTPLNVPENFKLGTFFEVESFYVFDNARFKLYAACSVDLNNLESSFSYAENKTLEMAKTLKNLKTKKHSLSSKPVFEREFSEEEFKKMVEYVRGEILRGECIQCVISNFYKVFGKLNPVTFYRSLRRINPSPYLFFIKDGPSVLCGSSPETHLRVKQGKALLKPIAGTVPLDKNKDVEELKKSLLNDPKERAEHLMLLDLARNDLYAGCKTDSVKPLKMFEPEVYSHVIHIVSEVTGELDKNMSPFALFSKTFPAGTLTGAPKVRAMELIEETEKNLRGFYGGCVGYFSYSGDLDTCITIRSALFEEDYAVIRAGAGIVADSVPEKEFLEVEGKLGALFKAFDMMEEMEA